MTDIQALVEITDVEPHLSLDRACQLLIECEKAQFRYQWSSGLLLQHLMNDPETPTKLSEFVEWLARRTGMILTQNEIRRRLIVYRFYSKFADEQIIDLIKRNGINVAYRARAVIDQTNHEQARTVLQACLESPRLDETLQRFGEQRRLGKSKAVKRDRLRTQLSQAAQRFEGQEWVPLSVVLDLLDSPVTEEV
jgi:hypothetical protein